MVKQFKVKWADSECDVRAAQAQARAMGKLPKLLKDDGFELSHTDDDGFAVYLPTGKAKRRKTAKKKSRHPYAGCIGYR